MKRGPKSPEEAYLYLREHHRTSEPYCEDCGVETPCPVALLLADYDRMARNLDDATERLARPLSRHAEGEVVVPEGVDDIRPY